MKLCPNKGTERAGDGEEQGSKIVDITNFQIQILLKILNANTKDKNK